MIAIRAAIVVYFIAQLTILAAAEPDLGSLHQQYVRKWSKVMETYSQSSKALTHYNISYFLHGMLSAVEARKDEALLRGTMHYLDNMIAAAKDLNGDGHQEWGPLDKNGRPIQLYMLQGAGPIARAAAVIAREPVFSARYGREGRRYIAFVQDSIINYWYVKTYDKMLSMCFKKVWDDKCSHFGMIATFMYQATGKDFHRDIANGVAKEFRGRLQMNHDGWIWDRGTIPFGYGGNRVGSPDTAHANREAMMMLFMHESGIEFDVEDIKRMAATLTAVIWNGSLANPMFANYISGSNKPYRKLVDPGSNGVIYAGWVLMGSHSRRAQDAGLHLMKAIVNDTRNPSVKANAGIYGNTALTGHLMRNDWLRRQQQP